MKITQLLIEANSPKLLKLVKGPDYDNVGPYYVFLWQPDFIKNLIAAGAKRKGGVSGARLSSDYGLGIVDVRTGDICVGGIVDDDGELKAYWTSTTDDPKEFFDRVQQDGIKKIRNFPSRLQYLADRFKVLKNDADEDGEEVTSSGVQKIIDTLKSDEDYYKLANSFEFDTDDVVEAKKHLEDSLRKMKLEIHKTQKRVKKLYDLMQDPNISDNMSEEQMEKLVDEYYALGGGALVSMEESRDQLEKFLRVERDLFDPALDSDDESSDDTEDKDTDKELKNAEKDIQEWQNDFNEDFPKLDIDAMSLYPSY